MAAKRRRRRKKDGGGIRREEGRSFGHEKHEETRKGGIGRSEVRRVAAKRRRRRKISEFFLRLLRFFAAKSLLGFGSEDGFMEFRLFCAFLCFLWLRIESEGSRLRVVAKFLTTESREGRREVVWSAGAGRKTGRRSVLHREGSHAGLGVGPRRGDDAASR